MNPTTCLRSMLVCLLKGDDAGAADGAAQLSAWIMDTAREARDMARSDAKAAAILEPAKPSPCDYRGCTLAAAHAGPHRDVDGIPFAASNAKPTKPARTLGPADDATADVPRSRILGAMGAVPFPGEVSSPAHVGTAAESFYCDCHPDREHASLAAAEACERATADATKPADVPKPKADGKPAPKPF